ncbi:hypothetical protein C6Q09_29680 [Burkholderia multivorans]|nr:hypothetical protein C6Q09_29680 [Burkholderia multivorans]
MTKQIGGQFGSGAGVGQRSGHRSLGWAARRAAGRMTGRPDRGQAAMIRQMRARSRPALRAVPRTKKKREPQFARKRDLAEDVERAGAPVRTNAASRSARPPASASWTA